MLTKADDRDDAGTMHLICPISSSSVRRSFSEVDWFASTNHQLAFSTTLRYYDRSLHHNQTHA